MRGFAGLFALLLLFVITAPVAAAQATADVRLTHLSPDTAQVDVWVDGAKIKEYLGYQRTSEYISLPAGEHQVEIRPYREANVLAELAVTLETGERYTLGITGLSGQNDLQLLTLLDDRVPVYLFAKVRFVHASPGVPAVDIAIANGGPLLVSNLEYRQNSGYVTVRPDVYDLEVRIAGTTTVLFTIPNAGLSRAANCTIYTTGESDVAGVVETIHTFEHNGPLDHNQLILGLALWAALLAWFVHNHMRGG